MSERDQTVHTASIRQYFTRSTSQDSVHEDFPPNNQKLVQSKMAKVTNNDLQKLMSDLASKMASMDEKLDEKMSALDQKMSDGFSSLNIKIKELDDKFDVLESDVAEVKVDQVGSHKKNSELENAVNELRRSLLASQVYSRKYHLLLYGIEGYEISPEETIKVVRNFAKNSLKLGEEFANRVTIRNAHRLRRNEGPTAIIVVFLYWSEREAFMNASRNLKGTGKSVRTDLPPELKQYRHSLAGEAYKLRQELKIHTRIRERGADIWLETRTSLTDQWRKYDI